MSKRTCSVKGCSGSAIARGWCKAHYQRWWSYGDPLGTPGPRQPPSCSVDGCELEHAALGYCGKHYQRFKKYGTAEERPFVPSTCTVGGCDAVVLARGWCCRHYNRWKMYGDPLAESRVPERGQCKVARCPRRLRGDGYCELHRRRWKNGTPLDAPVRGIDPRFCKEPGCDEPYHSLGWCKKHYYELQIKPLYPVYNQRQRQRYEQASPEEKAERARLRHEAYMANRESIRARSLARYNEQYKDDPAPWRAAKSRRKMRSAAGMVREDIAISVDYRRAIRKDRCFYCGAADTAHTDHFFPLAKGGTDHWWNLVRACKACNLSKNAHCGTWFLLRMANGPRIAAAVA